MDSAIVEVLSVFFDDSLEGLLQDNILIAAIANGKRVNTFMTAILLYLKNSRVKYAFYCFPKRFNRKLTTAFTYLQYQNHPLDEPASSQASDDIRSKETATSR